MAKKGISMGSMVDLFNAASKAEKKGTFKIQLIDIDQIVPNEINDYSIDGIEELALSISYLGVKQNLDVMALPDGKYKLLTGERRYTAVKKLVEEGREDLRMVPCTVSEPVELDLPIPDEIKELWLLTATNREQRMKTDADMMMEVRNQRRIYQALLDSGVEIKGKARDVIAQALDISASTVQRIEFVDKKLEPDLKTAFEENKIPLTVAVEAAKMDKQGQASLTEAVRKKGKLTKADIDEVKPPEPVEPLEGQSTFDDYTPESNNVSQLPASEPAKMSFNIDEIGFLNDFANRISKMIGAGVEVSEETYNRLKGICILLENQLAKFADCLNDNM